MWIPLPFPQCPSCSKSWSISYHHNCPFNGEVEVETEKEISKCQKCFQEWGTIEGIFYCSCGHSFSGVEVKDAIEKSIQLKIKLKILLAEMDLDTTQIDQITQHSLSKWLNNVSYEIGKTLGTLAGSVINLIKSIFG